MPSKFTSKESNDDAVELANNLGFKLESISIESVVNSYDQILGPIFEGKEKKKPMLHRRRFAPLNTRFSFVEIS